MINGFYRCANIFAKYDKLNANAHIRLKFETPFYLESHSKNRLLNKHGTVFLFGGNNEKTEEEKQQNFNLPNILNEASASMFNYIITGSLVWTQIHMHAHNRNTNNKTMHIQYTKSFKKNTPTVNPSPPIAAAFALAYRKLNEKWRNKTETKHSQRRWDRQEEKRAQCASPCRK